MKSSKRGVKLRGSEKEPEQPAINLNAYDWLMEAKIINKKFEHISPQWIRDNADIIVLIFTAHKIDKDGILKKFYEIYETAKFINVPLEVIYVPLDDEEKDMVECFKKQANWFALTFHDPLVHILKYMYEVTCLPYIRIISVDCSLISEDGIRDLEVYGKNAILSWLSTSSTMKQHRNFHKDCAMYDEKWVFLTVGKEQYQPKRFNVVGGSKDDEEPESDKQETAEEVVSPLVKGDDDDEN